MKNDEDKAHELEQFLNGEINSYHDDIFRLIIDLKDDNIIESVSEFEDKLSELKKLIKLNERNFPELEKAIFEEVFIGDYELNKIIPIYESIKKINDELMSILGQYYTKCEKLKEKLSRIYNYLDEYSLESKDEFLAFLIKENKLLVLDFDSLITSIKNDDLEEEKILFMKITWEYYMGNNGTVGNFMTSYEGHYSVLNP